MARVVGPARDDGDLPVGKIPVALRLKIAQAVLYLASDDAAFVTGTALTIDGGITAA